MCQKKVRTIDGSFEIFLQFLGLFYADGAEDVFFLDLMEFVLGPLFDQLRTLPRFLLLPELVFQVGRLMLLNECPQAVCRGIL